jgi:hypothetical protein
MRRSLAIGRRAAPVLLAVGTAGSLVFATLGLRVACAVALIASVMAEVPVERWARTSADRLRRIGLGLSVRTALRFAAAVVISRADGSPATATTAVAQCGTGLLGIIVLNTIVRVRLRRRRIPVIATRGVALDALRVPKGPPEVVVSGSGWFRSTLELPFLLVAALSFDPRTIWLVGSLGILAALVAALIMASASWRIGERLGPDSMISLVQSFLDGYRPEVILYFSGGATSAYQVNMWLSTIERLPQRALVVLRERSTLSRLGQTTIPVLCIPGATHLMSLDFADVVVGLFTANVGKNIHLLREPRLMSAFIGHGDSDKNASSNPVSRSYDEIWVAGEAGRERYRRAQVGVRNDQIVHVGRPQLDAVQRSRPRPDGWVPTILYAPTWEGWDADQQYSSLQIIGLQIVRAVLDHPTPLRLIYKPHPFMGARDPQMEKAHRLITHEIQEANARLGHILGKLRHVGLTDASSFGDPADQAVESGKRPGRSAVEAEQQQRLIDSEYFRSLPPDAHLVAEPGSLALFSCFDEADALVTDVSSVVSDFMVSGKPYAVCNPSNLTMAEFVHMFPSAAAGTVITREGEGIAALLAVASGTATDSQASVRRQHAIHLLGDDHRPATELFGAAVDSLTRRAKDRNDSRGAVIDSGETDLSEEVYVDSMESADDDGPTDEESAAGDTESIREGLGQIDSATT